MEKAFAGYLIDKYSGTFGITKLGGKIGKKGD